MTRIELAMEPSAGAFVGREHRLAVRVYYEDTDFTGFVYHASYARFFERGRSDFLRVLGFGHAALLKRSDPLAFAVLRLDIQFLKAARIDDALVVITTWGSSVGARMKVAQEIRRGVDLIATAAVEAVCITPTGAARRPPADLVARLAPLLAGAGDLS
jgi:acyl-CoA thioester hydrolase